MDDYMLTTLDNPYNPFTDFKKWNNYDQAAGYYSTSLLGRVVVSSDALSEADQSLAIKLAIDEIVRENVLGIYTTITEAGVMSSIVDQPSIQPDTPLPMRDTVAELSKTT